MLVLSSHLVYLFLLECRNKQTGETRWIDEWSQKTELYFDGSHFFISLHHLSSCNLDIQDDIRHTRQKQICVCFLVQLLHLETLVVLFCGNETVQWPGQTTRFIIPWRSAWEKYGQKSFETVLCLHTFWLTI